MTLKRRIREIDERRFGGRARAWILRNAVLGGKWGEFLDQMSAPAGAVVLDLGAGEAELRARFAGARYLAIDRGVGHGGWDYSRLDVVADAVRIPLADASVDLIVCKQVLEHIPEPVAMLRECARVMKPGARILLSTNQAWPQHQQPHDFFRFTSFGLRYCFEQAGLEIERMEAMGGVFTAALFHFTQTLSPHLWGKTPRAERVATVLTRPFGILLRLLVPVVTWLDRLDPTKDNTLGWYVTARAPTPTSSSAAARAS